MIVQFNNGESKKAWTIGVVVTVVLATLTSDWVNSDDIPYMLWPAMGWFVFGNFITNSIYK